MAHLPPPSAQSPLNTTTTTTSTSSSTLGINIDIDHQHNNNISYLNSQSSFSSPSSNIRLPSADPFSLTPTLDQQQQSLLLQQQQQQHLQLQLQQQQQQLQLQQQQQQGLLSSSLYPASHITKLQQQPSQPLPSPSSQPHQQQQLLQQPQDQQQLLFEQQRLALQQQHLQAQLQVQRIQLQQRKRLLEQQQQAEQQLRSGLLVVDGNNNNGEQKVFTPERHHSAPSLPFVSLSQSSSSHQQLQQQQQQQTTTTTTFPISSSSNSSSSFSSSFPAAHPLHPLYALHPLQFSYPPSSQQQQQQLSPATFPSNHISTSSSSSTSTPSSSSVALPNLKTESSDTNISSMGVLAMPPFLLHSSHHHNPFSSSSSSSTTTHSSMATLQDLAHQQQQQQYLATSQTHSTRHHSFPSASNPTTDHFQLFQQPHQQQQQQQVSNGIHSSGLLYQPGTTTLSASAAAAAQTSTSSSQSQQQPLPSSFSMQQPHYQHASVSPSPSTTVSTSFQGTDNDMTPAISALEIRHYPHQDNVSETGSASRPPQQHGDGYISWSKADGLLSHRTLTVPVGHRGPGDNSEEIIRRLSHSSAGSEVNTIRSASSISMFDDNDMVQYSLEARIIQKKDQLEELSATGAIIPTPIVEEVRTGQQFLIKIHLSKNSSSLPSRFPALRVGRREAINTAGEARSEPEPLTLEIAVHLAKSGQTRKGACAKCCHKYGPSSPILVLLDPLSPSVTDPVNYAHIDTTSGSITMLAKVLCSSTDHGERGNKDRYIFEFRLKSTSSMPLIPSSTLSTSDASSRASEAPEDEGDTVSSCFTQPIMCSGHHKAKRVYPHQRPIKTPKGVPTPKTKTIKRHKSVPTITMPHQGGSHSMTGETSSSSDHLVDSVGPMSGHSGFSSNMSFLSGPLSQLSDYSHHPHHQHHQHLNDINSRSHILDNQGQPLLSTSSTTINNNSNNPNSTTTTANSTHGLQDPLQHSQSQCPRITEVRPSHGPIRKTTDVVLRGLAFREGMVPYFGCFPALDIIVETANLMVCKAPESPLPGTVGISIYDHLGNSFSDLGQFTYTDDSETELLILQLQLRLAHRALEYMHTRATGQKGNAADILREIPGLATSPRSGSVLMMDAREGLTEATEATEAIVVDGEVDEDMPLMTLAQIEESIMNTLDNVPRGMDISVQLDDGTNMLHLAILLGFNYLAVRLIEEGCDLEALDAWSMTPLMYTVLKGNEAIARIFVIAGASSSGASTPQEFYARLPRQVEPTQAMYNFLSVSCTRFSGSPRLYTLESATFDSEMAAVEEQDDEEEEWTETSSDSSIETVPIARSVVTPPLIKAEDESSASTLASPEATIGPSEGGAGQKQLTDLASTIQGVRVTPFMPPLDQQDLPPLQKVEEDGSVTINSKVVQGAEIYGGHGAELFRNVNPESGYHSGVYSEVQEQLNRLHLTTLPSEGVQMSVSLKKLTPSSSSATRRQQSSSTVISAMPLELFRTGDSFGVEIKLGSSDAQVPMPKECLGLRFPHEMVKRVSGRPASILTEMTYILRATVELGKTSMALTPEQSSSAAEEQGHGHEQEEHYGDGIPLIGSCQACSKFLHEHKKLSPSRRSQTDPSVYPVLQFSIPGGSSTNPTTTATTTTTTAMAAAAAASSAGVVELRDGVCEIKAKVNCSSLHHLIQRERARRIAELKRRQQEAVASVTSTTCATESSSTNTTTTATSTTKTKKSSLAMTDLQDPGFVFKFEVVHPTLGTVVARCETKPILFQSYSRGREGK